MNSHEYTDPDSDALTITTRGDQVWITCTTETTEVTIGPIPAEKLRPVFGASGPLDTDGGVTAALIEQETACGYCHQPGTDPCGKRIGAWGYWCSRPQGHDGEHVACSTSEHALAHSDSPQEPRPEPSGYATPALTIHLMKRHEAEARVEKVEQERDELVRSLRTIIAEGEQS